MVKAFLSASKAEWHSSEKCQRVPLQVRHVSGTMNEVMVKVGKAEERLNILDFSWYWPILDDLDFFWGHGEAVR